MCKILILGGTTEGRILTQFCKKQGIAAWVSVVSEYGRRILEEDRREECAADQRRNSVRILERAMDREDMVRFIKEHGILLVVDATHPYARQVSAHIREACEICGVRLVRCLRERDGERAPGRSGSRPASGKATTEIRETATELGETTTEAGKARIDLGEAMLEIWRKQAEAEGQVITAANAQEAAAFLKDQVGAVLVTTGSRELAAYTVIPDYEKRLYARVLPSVSVLQTCETLGIRGRHLIAMQGPFSVSMNEALLKETKAAWMVTKESGKEGGFPEKLEAARRCGVRVIVLRRPEEKGESVEAVCRILEKFAQEREESSANDESLEKQESPAEHPPCHVVLAGIGMGTPETMTEEVRRALLESDAVFGAGRMVETAGQMLRRNRPETEGKDRSGAKVCTETDAETGAESPAVLPCLYATYKPEEILAALHANPQWKRASVVYSGDTGFYSGAAGLARRLQEEGYSFRILPGISSISYFAARVGVNWESAALVSCHGRPFHLPDLLAMERERYILLLGGEQDAGTLCRILAEQGYGSARVTVGERLSYPEERICRGTAEELKDQPFDPLSVAMIEGLEERRLTEKTMPEEKREETVASGSDRKKTVCQAENRQGGIPRFMLAAPRSGSGKTLLTCGILEVLKRAGYHPAAFKCGPDYIDPMFHAYVLDVPGANLDTFFLEPEAVRKLFSQVCEEKKADAAVLEGVMGYYDGIGGTSGRASSWEVAGATETPVILVVDCKGASLSAAAEAAGFAGFRQGSRIAGLILNRISSMYYERLAPVIQKETGLPVLGYLPEADAYRLESRHLGLLLPGEISRLRERIGLLADQLEKSLDLERLLQVCAGAQPDRNFEGGVSEPTCCELPKEQVFDSGRPGRESVEIREPSGGTGFGVRIGVARDEAFCFYYQENLAMLERMGAKLCWFSPLHDTRLPDGLDGLLLGGGYPETYGAQLAENQEMRRSIRDAVGRGLPILAECGGFLYLHKRLEGSDGKFYPMAGVVEADAFRTSRLGRFGYVYLTASDGLTVKGHEFHYWESGDPGEDWQARKPVVGEDGNLLPGGRSWRCIHGTDAQIWGFPHLYYPSNPEFARRWLAQCRMYREKKENEKDGREGF